MTDWTKYTSNNEWFKIASSHNGQIVACVGRDTSIYISVNSGTTFTTYNSVRNWRDIAMSSSGNKIVAVVSNGNIYTSNDTGQTWTSRDDSRNWTGVTSSANGVNLAATIQGGYIYTSTNSGETWSQQTGSGDREWKRIGSSSNGSVLTATVADGYVYTSYDSGVNWTERTNVGRSNWYGVDLSSNGVKQVITSTSGSIYTSTDSGATWTSRGSSRLWGDVASSGDGINLVAAVYGGNIYTSNDSGVNWVSRESVRNWWSVAISNTAQAEGYKMYATADNEGIFSSNNSGVSCIVKNTKILCKLNNGDDSEVFIENLTPQHFIKTSFGYRKIKHLLINHINRVDIKHMVRQIDAGSITHSIPNKLTYFMEGHGLLFDESELLTYANETYKYKNYKIIIDEKYKLIAGHCVFSKKPKHGTLDYLLTEDNKLPYYHIVLEPDDNSYDNNIERYGIYCNNILTETISIKNMNRSNFNKIF
jgi:photosystem II stability/assembly factor-like uncharacterized protein